MGGSREPDPGKWPRGGKRAREGGGARERVEPGGGARGNPFGGRKGKFPKRFLGHELAVFHPSLRWGARENPGAQEKNGGPGVFGWDFCVGFPRGSRFFLVLAETGQS